MKAYYGKNKYIVPNHKASPAKYFGKNVCHHIHFSKRSSRVPAGRIAQIKG